MRRSFLACFPDFSFHRRVVWERGTEPHSSRFHSRADLYSVSASWMRGDSAWSADSWSPRLKWIFLIQVQSQFSQKATKIPSGLQKEFLIQVTGFLPSKELFLSSLGLSGFSSGSSASLGSIIRKSNQISRRKTHIDIPCERLIAVCLYGDQIREADGTINPE